jgi:hypothetical protein
MDGADIKVGSSPDGFKAIIVTDLGSGIEVLIPMTSQSAKAVARALNGGIEVANKFPAMAGVEV